MSANEMRERFESDELTWADLLEITGLPATTLYEILEGLI
jgi:sugar-specific transcriptional regulator TrmB